MSQRTQPPPNVQKLPVVLMLVSVSSQCARAAGAAASSTETGRRRRTTSATGTSTSPRSEARTSAHVFIQIHVSGWESTGRSCLDKARQRRVRASLEYVKMSERYVLAVRFYQCTSSKARSLVGDEGEEYVTFSWCFYPKLLKISAFHPGGSDPEQMSCSLSTLDMQIFS